MTMKQVVMSETVLLEYWRVCHGKGFPTVRVASGVVSLENIGRLVAGWTNVAFLVVFHRLVSGRVQSI